jgi:hypothetical protein
VAGFKSVSIFEFLMDGGVSFSLPRYFSLGVMTEGTYVSKRTIFIPRTSTSKNGSLGYNTLEFGPRGPTAAL